MDYIACLEDMDRVVPSELLPALVALLETESVTLAAKRMHVGQPAMSRTLERLRDVTSDALLVRAGRRLVRTQRGDELLPDARATLDAVTRLLAPKASFSPADATGVVTFALGDDMQAVLAGTLLERLRRDAPGLDIRVRPLSQETARDALRGDVDVAVFPDIRRDYPLPSIDEIVLSPQYTRRFVTVSRKKRRLTLESFLAAEHALVSPTGTEGGYVDDALRAIGRRRRVAVAVPSFQAALTLVQQTDLVATLPDDLLRVLAPSLHRRPCPVPTPELPMCVAWAARFTKDPRHRWLRGHVVEVVRAVGRARPRAPSVTL